MQMFISEEKLMAIFEAGDDKVKKEVRAVAPELFMPDLPVFAVGKKSGALYLIVDANHKTRLTDGAWKRFKAPIGVLTEGVDIDDYDIVTGMDVTTNED
jgi:hypothetical protein